MENKILIINTGGTISMVGKPLRPAFSFQDMAKEFPILSNFNADYTQIKKLIDSSDANIDFWKEIATIIYENYEKYLGFVILHGTDTMAYTGSILSFMLKNLSKPVVITGAQTPISFPRSDALQNLINSIYIASYSLFDLECVPEVSICFRDTLLRANRSRKIDANNFVGFSSPNFPKLASLGSDINIFENRILTKNDKKFYIDTNISDEIMMLELFPAMKLSYLENILNSCENLKVIILKTYGTGNTPSDEKFFELLENIIAKGIIIIDVTQCLSGKVKMPLYQSTDKLYKIGVVNGKDITPEAAITKAMYLLGKNLSIEKFKEEFTKNIAGEI